MKRKILNRLFLFLLFLLTWLDLQKYALTPVGKISAPLPLFPQIQIKLLQAPQENLVEDALRETSKTLLNYFVPQLAQRAWQLDFVFLNLLANPEKEVALAFSLPPDQGLLVLLQKKDNYYYLAAKKELGPLTKLEVLSFDHTTDCLVTCESQKTKNPDQNSTPVKVWLWRENNLQLVFEEKTNWEIKENTFFKQGHHFQQNLKLTWIKASRQIQTKGTQKLSVDATFSQSPLLLKKRTLSQNYYWDETWQSFILQTNYYQPAPDEPPQEIAILQNLSLQLPSLALNSSPTYQVLNQQREIFILPEEALLQTIPPPEHSVHTK